MQRLGFYYLLFFSIAKHLFYETGAMNITCELIGKHKHMLVFDMTQYVVQDMARLDKLI